MMPVKRYGVSRIRINPNLFDREIIRRIIHNIYCRKESPTLCSVLEKVKEEFGFPGGKFCLWRVLKEMGYSYKKKDNKQFLYEQRSILEQRDTYLQQIRKLRQQNVNLVYTDKTWVNKHHNNDYVWIDSDGKGGWKVPSGKGEKLIVLHAGGVNGWVEEADLVFKSKTNSADYHYEMNSEHFFEWMTEKLLPTLNEPSVIILDNASYHNKQQDKPTATQNKKGDIREWLDEHNITYEHTNIKKTLLDNVNQHRPKPMYLTDELANEYGHNIVFDFRLGIVNSIQLSWHRLQ